MLSRIVFYDSTGKYSEVRPISGIGALAGTSQTISWPASAGALNITPSRAKVDNKDRRFTWMLSVRRGYSGASFMDVVVFHKRTFSGKDEQVFPTTFTATIDPGFDGLPGIGGYDDDQNGTRDDASELGYLGSDDSPRNWIVVQYNESTTGKPYVKKGGFVADADNLRWYRILDIVESDLVTPSTPTGVMTKAGLSPSIYTPDAIAPGMTNALLLRVENKILQSGPTSGLGAAPIGGAIVMRGIVDVYPIRTHLTWEN